MWYHVAAAIKDRHIKADNYLCALQILWEPSKGAFGPCTWRLWERSMGIHRRLSVKSLLCSQHLDNLYPVLTNQEHVWKFWASHLSCCFTGSMLLNLSTLPFPQGDFGHWNVPAKFWESSENCLIKTHIWCFNMLRYFSVDGATYLHGDDDVGVDSCHSDFINTCSIAIIYWKQPKRFFLFHANPSNRRIYLRPEFLINDYCREIIQLHMLGGVSIWISRQHQTK